MITTSCARTIERISLDYQAQPSLEDIASDLGVAPGRLQKTFSRWAGLTPKAFLQAVTLDHARRLLGHEGLPLLDASYELGLSGPGRLHDLFVTHEAMSPGDFKTGGAGLAIRYGFHPSPFGTAVIMATERGLCGLAFADPGEEQAALADMTKRWPGARVSPDQEATAPYAGRIFSPGQWRADQPLRIVMIGTDFPGACLGGACSGSRSAPPRPTRTWPAPSASPRPRARWAPRSGANPISFVVPCHPGDRQVRRADRLSLGHHPQAGDAGLGDGVCAGGYLIAGFNAPWTYPPAPLSRRRWNRR